MFFDEQTRVLDTDRSETFHVQLYSFVQLLKRLVLGGIALLIVEVGILFRAIVRDFFCVYIASIVLLERNLDASVNRLLEGSSC